MRRVIITGPEDFEDRSYLFRTLDLLLPAPREVEVLTEADRNGTALLAREWAAARTALLGPASAEAEALIAFWDEEARDTRDLIRRLAANGKPVTIVLCPRDARRRFREAEHRRILKYVQIWTDASTSRKHGVAGYAFLIRAAGKSVEQAEAESQEAIGSPRAELEAIRRALSYFPLEKRRGLYVELTSDSEWSLESLKAVQDLRLGNPPQTLSAYNYLNLKPDSRERLEPVADLIESYGRVRLVHVKGHNGHIENERCDQLAGAAVARFRQQQGEQP